MNDSKKFQAEAEKKRLEAQLTSEKAKKETENF